MLDPWTTVGRSFNSGGYSRQFARTGTSSTAVVVTDRKPYSRKKLNIGRNAKCLCGSGRKFKHCCLRKDASP